MTEPGAVGRTAATSGGRRELLVVLTLLLVAAVTLLAAGNGEPVARGAGLFALAATGGIVATRTVGRRIVGVVTALVGVVDVVAAASWSVVLGGGLLVVAGVATTWRAPRWPSLSSRYESQQTSAASPTRHAHDLWNALDKGEDPTQGDGDV